jgi:hypothetical protein
MIPVHPIKKRKLSLPLLVIDFERHLEHDR